MPHTYTNLLVHATFSTKDRVPLLGRQPASRIFAHMCLAEGIAAKPTL